MKKLLDIVKRLRAPDGCPWDRQQTHKSLIPYVLEETWEVIDEIHHDRLDKSLADELGDLLLQIALHSEIAEEDGRFSFNDVVEQISEKMVRRHPHVFTDQQNTLTEQQLRAQWQDIKDREKETMPIQQGIPESAPALMNALKISKKAAGLGFDWESPWDVLLKVEEEIGEVKQEMEKQATDLIEHEIGDLLFTVVNLARKYNINPEIALKKGNDKFLKRFSHLEPDLIQLAKEGNQMTMDEMQKRWEEAKRIEN